MVIQPQFDPAVWTVVTHWPAAVAAQARLHDDGTAARPQVYAGPIELANAYDEETDAEVLAPRLQTYAQASDLTVDQKLVRALRHGLPRCAGVAVGFDRLVQVVLGPVNPSLETQAFAWPDA